MSLIPQDIASFRSDLLEAEATMLMEGALAGTESEQLCPVRHDYADGCYIREWNCPAGVLTVSKIHKVAHPYFVMSGSVSVLTEKGTQHIEGPYHGITQPGTKRILFSHTETQWVTVHVTDETDLALIEDEIIAKDFADPKITEADMKQLMEREA